MENYTFQVESTQERHLFSLSVLGVESRPPDGRGPWRRQRAGLWSWMDSSASLDLTSFQMSDFGQMASPFCALVSSSAILERIRRDFLSLQLHLLLQSVLLAETNVF